MTPALFLDRDGVINEDFGYVHQIEKFKFVEGIFDLCREAKELGMEIHVVTNQAGIARGYYTEQVFAELSEWMCQVFVSEGAALAGVHYCPYHPEHGLGAYRIASARRKPEPGMILDAANTFNLNLPASVMIGDKATDIAAALAAGVGTPILFSGDAGEIAACPPGTRVAASLAEARRIMRSCVRPHKG